MFLNELKLHKHVRLGLHFHRSMSRNPDTSSVESTRAVPKPQCCWSEQQERWKSLKLRVNASVCVCTCWLSARVEQNWSDPLKREHTHIHTHTLRPLADITGEKSELQNDAGCQNWFSKRDVNIIIISVTTVSFIITLYNVMDLWLNNYYPSIACKLTAMLKEQLTQNWKCPEMYSRSGHPTSRWIC